MDPRCVFLLLAVAVAVAAYPTLPPAWSAAVAVHGGPAPASKGLIHYDTVSQAYALKFRFVFDQFAFGYDIYDLPSQNAHMLLVENQCRNTTTRLAGMFAWLPLASKGITHTVNGVQCTEWTYQKTADIHHYVNISACISGSALPVQFSAQQAPNASAMVMDFTNVVLHPPPLVVPDLCHLPMNVCHPLDPPTQTIPMVRFHPAGDLYLNNTNTADYRGDALFVCMSLARGAASATGQVSLLEVAVDTRYGQYGLCNFGHCDGGDNYHVGREVALGIGPWGGQCRDDPDHGTWYSLPAGGYCPPGTLHQHLGDSCTWGLSSVTKTINASCLFDRGFAAACHEAEGLSFAAAAKVMARAFASSDAAQGGCPSVSGGSGGGGDRLHPLAVPLFIPTL